MHTGWQSWFNDVLPSHADRALRTGKDLTAEVKTEEFIAGKGLVTKWERRKKQNHWFDTLYNACAAGNYCGVTLEKEESKPSPPPKPKRQERQPWIDVERWRENNAKVFGHLRDRQ